MEFETFQQSLRNGTLPENISGYLQALWYDRHGDWAKAHNMVDALEDKTACWVHAYLHRKEGDNWNADYWYRKAGKVRPDVSVEKEWETIVQTLL